MEKLQKVNTRLKFTISHRLSRSLSNYNHPQNLLLGTVEAFLNKIQNIGAI